ncbi:MAG TPA: hypothetical protein VE524_04515, partial [Nitrososphaeraceae archaeon]|nr:hypothetical protein [Nitrososphaeraceae archaeon]
DFLNKLYNEYKEQRLPPDGLARLFKVINAYPGINSLNELPNKIKKREREKIKLDAEIYYKKLEIQKLDHEKEKKRKEIQDLQEELESFRKEMREEKKDFMLFKDAKDELKKHGIPIHILEPLIDVIKIFNDMHFRPLTILSEFSDIDDYRHIVENKNNKLKELESHIQNLKSILDSHEKKIASNQVIVQSLNKLENIGFNASDIKTLERVFSGISEKYGLNKEEIKTLFFRYINCFNTLLSLQQDILEKTDKISLLDSEISSRRKVIESQPIVFSILQNLVSAWLNENEILVAFNIFKTDLCNNMPYGDRTYLERLSKDLNKYPTVRDTLQGLNTKILVKKSRIEKLASVKSKLESFLFSLVVTIYFYSIILNAQVQIQKNLRIALFISNFNYLPLLCIVTKPNKFVRSKFKIEQNNNNKKRRKEKETKNCKDKKKSYR